MPLPSKRSIAAVVALCCLLLVDVSGATAAQVNGDLTPLGCVDLLADTCEGATPVPTDLANALVPSPDGSDLYVLVDDAVLDVRAAANGGMTFDDCWAATDADGCTAQPFIDGEMRQIAISPDGRFVYLATTMHFSSGPAETLVVFQRDPASGGLSELQCIGPAPDDACPSATPTHIEGAWRVAVSPDGSFVDIAGVQWEHATYTVASFARAADGSLSEVGCLASQPVAGCITSPGLSFPHAIVEAPDRAHVYAVGNSSILTLARTDVGALREVGCLSAPGSGDASCQVVPGAATIDTMALSADGRTAYVLSNTYSLGDPQIWNLHVTPDGALADAGCGLHGQPEQCFPSPDGSAPSIAALDGSMLYLQNATWNPLYQDGSVGPRAGLSLPNASAVATTPAAVYYFAGGSLFSFARVPPVAPTCTGTSATVVRPGGLITLQCTDPRGQPLRFTLDSPPAHGTVPSTAVGTLGGVQFQYVPVAGSATSDSFTFHVDDGLAVGATQTVTVAITPAAAPLQSPASPRAKALRQVALSLGSASILHVRHRVATIAFRCGHVRCRGTVALLRAGRTLARARFTADRTGTAHVALHLPRSLRPSSAGRVRLRVSASASGWRSRTVERSLTLAFARA